MGRLLIILGSVFVLLGVAITVGSKLGLGHLPGDFVLKRKNFALYIPIATSILISIILTLLLNIFRRR